MSRDSRYAFFYDVAHRLRKELPCGSVVRVQLRKGYESYGTCHYVEKGKNPRFVIVIRKTGDVERDAHILLHEYAHVLAWFTEAEHHGSAWQESYGKVYRWYETEMIGDDE